MKPNLFIIPVVFVGQALLGQKPVIEPSLGIAQAQFREAQEASLHDDPDLTAQLFTISPAEAHRRIHRAAALRDDFMEKKGVYLSLVVKHFAEMRTRLGSQNAAQLPIQELRTALDEEQARVLADQERVEALIRDLPQGDEYTFVMRDLNAERTELINLQNSLAMRGRSLDKMSRDQEAVKDIETKDPLDKNLEAIGKAFGEVRDNVRKQRDQYAEIYATMDREVDKSAAPAANGKPSTVKPAPKPEKHPMPPQAQITLPSPDGAASAAFNGLWIYESRPNAWSGFGEPVRVTLELHRSGSRISGAYLARLPGKHDLRDLSLDLTGEEIAPGTAKIHWISRDPGPSAQGEMTLQLGGDRRLLVQRTLSSDTYIPRGMEVLLPR